MKLNKIFFSAAAAILMSGSMALAQSAKNAVQVNNTSMVTATCGNGWSNIGNLSIKTSQQKDLVMGVSLETALMTNTLVRSKGGTSDTSTAEAELRVRVLVDGAASLPGTVTFDKRTQTLMAKFNGICTDTNADGIVNYNECTDPEELQLILDTMAAHHFNFILPNVGTGTHAVAVQGCVRTAGSAQTGSWTASAAAGKGSFVVEEVRLVKNADVIF